MPLNETLLWPLLFTGSIALSFVLGQLFPAFNRQLALHPRRKSLWQLITFHWVHGNWRHLLFNVFPLFILSTLILIQGEGHFPRVTACIFVVAGTGTWLCSTATRVAGASALVFGYWGFVVSAAAISGEPAWTAAAAITLLFYSGLWASLGRVEKGISWSAHFWGLCGGILAALWQFGAIASF